MCGMMTLHVKLQFIYSIDSSQIILLNQINKRPKWVYARHLSSTNKYAKKTKEN